MACSVRFLFPCFADIVRSRCSVVPICNVSAWNCFKLCLEKSGIFDRTFPEYVSHAVVACYIAVGSILGYNVDAGLNLGLFVSKCEKDWFSVCILDLHELCSVLFFLGQG